MKDETRDFFAGTLLAVIGLFAGVHAGFSYDVGSPANMGPGFFPLVIGCTLALLGLVIALMARRAMLHQLQTQHTVERPPIYRYGAIKNFGWLPAVSVVAAIALFSQTLEALGLIPATILLTLCACLAQQPYRLTRSVVLAITLSVLAWLIFVVGLGMPVSAFYF